MNREDARQIVASYLVGGVVSEADLQDACDSLNRGDPEYVGFLEEELALSANPDLCAAFMERAAEFSELTERERRQEMPEFDIHLHSCEKCQALYRDVYTSVFSESVAWAGDQVRRLAEPIWLALAWTGKLSELGLGPLAVPTPNLESGGLEMGGAVLLGGEPAGPGESEEGPKEWTILLDELEDITVRIRLAGLQNGNVEMTFALEGAGSAAAAKEMRVELCKVVEERNDLGISGRLSAYRVHPLGLTPGRWLIRLLLRGATWEIPLLLEQETD